MSHERCWGLNRDGQRCEYLAMAGNHFCQPHWRLTGPDPSEVFCLPEAEMPSGLVEYLRTIRPSFEFPEPQVPIEPVAPEPAPAVPVLTAAPKQSAHPAASPAPAARERAAAAASPEGEDGPLDWLLATIRQATEEMMGSDARPQQKADAVARLGNLYLKTYRAAQLQKENRELKRRVVELEQALADDQTLSPADPESRATVPSSRPPKAPSRRRGTASAQAAEPRGSHPRPGQVTATGWDGVEEALSALVGSAGTSRAAP
jgi:hypothetical protein